MIILGFVISIRIILCTYFTTLCAAGCVNLPPLPSPPQRLIHLTQPSLSAGVCLRNGGCVVIVVVVVVVCRVTRIVIVQIKYVTTRPLQRCVPRCLLTVLCDSRVPLRLAPPRTATDSETRPLPFASVCTSVYECVRVFVCVYLTFCCPL